MHPLSTALFLLGYALALPIVGRLPGVVARQQRLAMWGHQLGFMLAAVGWITKGRIMVATVHCIWMAAAYGWFEFKGSRSSSPVQSGRRG